MADYEAFSAKRKVWIECLNGDDQNSIYKQLHQMSWDIAVYRTLAEIRMLASKDDEGNVKLSDLLFDLFDRNFWQCQAMAIRRLMDKNKPSPPEAGKNDKSVYSLVGLIGDIKANCNLCTRKNVFEAESLELDVERLEAEAEAYRRKQPANESIWFPKSLDATFSRNRHAQFDTISGSRGETRTQDDKILCSKLEKLESDIEESGNKFKLLVDKYVAHAASLSSRYSEDAKSITIEIKELLDAHKTLCLCSHALGDYYLGIGKWPMLAHPIFDHLKYLDQPMATATTMEHLESYWKDLEREVESWMRIDYFSTDTNVFEEEFGDE